MQLQVKRDCLSRRIVNILGPAKINIHSDLVDGCKKGNEKAFRDIYRLYSKAMFNICMRMTGNHAEAEDVLQEAFINAFRKIDSFESRSSFGAWIKRIVINTTVNHMNKQKALLINLEEDRMQFSDLPDTDYQSIELEVDNVKKAINKLPNGYRIVLSLYLLEGYDHKEIAEVLGISESTSKTQYIRAKKKLRELLSEEVYHA